MKQLKTVEHYIEGPWKPVLQEKQVFLVFLFAFWNEKEGPFSFLLIQYILNGPPQKRIPQTSKWGLQRRILAGLLKGDRDIQKYFVLCMFVV